MKIGESDITQNWRSYLEISIYFNLSEQVGWFELVMLPERIVKEKYFMYLKIILREVN